MHLSPPPSGLSCCLLWGGGSAVVDLLFGGKKKEKKLFGLLPVVCWGSVFVFVLLCIILWSFDN